MRKSSLIWSSQRGLSAEALRALQLDLGLQKFTVAEDLSQDGDGDSKIGEPEDLEREYAKAQVEASRTAKGLQHIPGMREKAKKASSTKILSPGKRKRELRKREFESKPRPELRRIVRPLRMRPVHLLRRKPKLWLNKRGRHRKQRIEGSKRSRSISVRFVNFGRWGPMAKEYIS